MSTTTLLKPKGFAIPSGLDYSKTSAKISSDNVTIVARSNCPCGSCSSCNAGKHRSLNIPERQSLNW